MKKILIVDDNQYLTTYLEKKFLDAGHEVIIELSGLSALTRLADYAPDFLFIDYVLPQINGDKLCQLIRKMEHLNQSYLVLMSAAAKEMQFNPDNIQADLIIAKGTYKETANLLFSIIASEVKPRQDSYSKEIVGLDSVYSRQMTKELLEKTHHLQTILDCISEGILESFRGQIVYANPAAGEILNKPLDQLLAARAEALFSESERGLIQFLQETINSRQGVVCLERPIKIEKKFLALRKLPLQGDPETSILILADVTEQIHREAQLHNYQAHLEKIVTERTAALQQARDTLIVERERLRSLTAQLLSAQEDERRRISLELHDELGQTLTAVQLSLQQVKDDIPTEAQATKNIVEEARSLLDRAAQQIRELSIFLRPSMLDELGLLPTLRWHLNGFRQRTNIDIRLESTGMAERLDTETETALYRIIQETLNNIARHAEARKVTIGLFHQASVVSGYIQDDGKGFDPNEKISSPSMQTGIGLLGMRERAHLLGGTLDIESSRGFGTRISFEIPLHRRGGAWTK